MNQIEIDYDLNTTEAIELFEKVFKDCDVPYELEEDRGTFIFKYGK